MTHKDEFLSRILPEKKDGIISSVVILPDDMEFETQNLNEKVYILLRRHFFTNFGWIVSSVFMLAIPAIVFLILSFFNIDIYVNFNLKHSYVFVFLFLWNLFIFTNAFMHFLDWYFNIYFITNERIIDFDFSPFGYHKISEAGLDCIVDATEESIGFLPMIFNYGDIYIQTSGEKREFDFDSVPKPAWVRDKIMDLRDMFFKKPK